MGLEHLDDSAAALWAERIADAEMRTPQTYRANGWVVEALLGAWSAIACTSVSDDESVEGSRVRRGLEAAVRRGSDRHGGGDCRCAAGGPVRRVGGA